MTADEILRSHLRRLADVFGRREGLCYRGPADFVLRHSTAYATAPYPRGAPRMPPLVCYGNAICNAARLGWAYVEGYALAPTLEVHQHAWNAGPGGVLLDTTWRNSGLAYFGVAFSVERADDATWNGDATVLDDSNRGWPLLWRLWEGEPEGVVWPASPRLELLRNPPADSDRLSMEELSRLAEGRTS